MKQISFAAIVLATAATAQVQTPLVPLTSESRVTTNADGAIAAQSVERIQLQNGQLADWRKTTSVTRQTTPGCTDTTEVRKQGDSLTAETTIRRTAADQDRVIGRVLTTETKASDGTMRREIVEYGLGLSDKLGRMATGDPTPQRKIVERTFQNPDGARSFKREVFRLDVNGDWKPVPYNWNSVLP
jgi:hypothetical protein